MSGGYRLSCEMVSQEVPGATFPNVVRIAVHGGLVYIEVIARHDGHTIHSTVVVERAVFGHHLRASGIASEVL